MGGNYYKTNLQEVVVKNIKKNWVEIGLGVVLIPVAANIITKVIRKPVILPANRMLKSVGLKDVKL
jgi:hypothetical protein